MTPEDDTSLLLRRCLARDEAAYRDLVRRYQRAVYTVAIRMVP